MLGTNPAGNDRDQDISRTGGTQRPTGSLGCRPGRQDIIDDEYPLAIEIPARFNYKGPALLTTADRRGCPGLGRCRTRLAKYRGPVGASQSLGETLGSSLRGSVNPPPAPLPELRNGDNEIDLFSEKVSQAVIEQQVSQGTHRRTAMALLAVVDLLLEQTRVNAQRDHPAEGVMLGPAETAAIGRDEVGTNRGRTAPAPRSGSVLQRKEADVTPLSGLCEGRGASKASGGIDEIDQPRDDGSAPVEERVRRAERWGMGMCVHRDFR